MQEKRHQYAMGRNMCVSWSMLGYCRKEKNSVTMLLGNKVPVLRPRCNGFRRGRTQILFYPAANVAQSARLSSYSLTAILTELSQFQSKHKYCSCRRQNCTLVHHCECRENSGELHGSFTHMKLTGIQFIRRKRSMTI